VIELLEQLNDPEMTKHVGGPESPEKLAARRSRYEKPDSLQYKIVVETVGEGVGWAVLPSFQGQGVASSATAQLIDMARTERKHRYVHAFSMVENAPSNAICRTLGFTLLGEIDLARQAGFVPCNDWRFDRFANSPGTAR
jgi:RimJ/RimL family protein N-acetyltransferase